MGGKDFIKEIVIFDVVIIMCIYIKLYFIEFSAEFSLLVLELYMMWRGNNLID